MDQERKIKGTLTVVAGVILRGLQILICQRPATKRFYPLKWEFPGGKKEKGETKRQALARELKEELGQDEVEIGRLLAKTTFPGVDYEKCQLSFYLVLLLRREVRNLEGYHDVQWVYPENLYLYDFLEGDRKIVRDISKGKINLWGKK